MQQSIELFECSKTAYLNILFSFAMTLSQLFYLFQYVFKHHPILWNTAKYAAIDRALRMQQDCLFKYFIFLRNELKSSCYLFKYVFKHHPILWNTAKYAAIDRALRMQQDCLFKYFIFLRNELKSTVLSISIWLLSIIRYSETQRNMQQSIELFECSKTAYLNI